MSCFLLIVCLLCHLAPWIAGPPRLMNGGRLSPSIAQSADIPRGQIINKVVCENNRDQSYALYLPSNYSPDRKWPILYAFDPGARGKIPVERFMEAAEKFGWIIAGSNSSRNGAFQPSLDAWNIMVKDTHDRFAIDDARVYLAGFSGGARFAIYLATNCRDCFAGVVACAAGFPNGVTPAASIRFAIFNTTGTEDFNFPEVRMLEGQLSKAGITHRTEVFTGRHDWLPSTLAIEALEWLDLQAMKTGKLRHDRDLIDSSWQKHLAQARALEAARELFAAYQAYISLHETFQGLREVGEMEKIIKQLHDSADVKNAIRAEQQQIAKQREIEGRINDLITVRERASEVSNRSSEENAPQRIDPETRLNGMFADLRKQATRTEDSPERRIARRVLEGVFIGLIEKGINLLEIQKRYDNAKRTLKLATEINPERAGAFYYLASAYAARGDKKQALRALQTAADKGFSDVAAVNRNKTFDSIRSEPQYHKIIELMQSKDPAKKDE